ncbi:hypothetical protein GCM10009642_41750 [Nocardiopsis metallicus]|uniref:transposase family protein n=1 Tax=Nocardiopsis metallicus TaxID=179819 RepID=UPI00337A6EFB
MELSRQHDPQGAMPAVSSSLTLSVLSTGPADDLTDHLSTIDDPRDPRGRRYSLPSLLALAVCALTSAGHHSTCAPIEWAHNTPRHVLLSLGPPLGPFTGRIHIPDERTLREVLARLDPAQLARAGLVTLNTHTTPRLLRPKAPFRANGSRRVRFGRTRGWVPFGGGKGRDVGVSRLAGQLNFSNRCNVDNGGPRSFWRRDEDR